MTMLNKKDQAILSQLRVDSRKRLTDIGRESSTPLSTVFDRLNKTQQKYIKRHTVLVDFHRLGYPLTAHILVNAGNRSNTNKALLASYLSKHPNVNNVARISSGYDYFVEAVFKDMKSMNQFIEELSENGSKEHKAFLMIEELKRESFLSDTSQL